MIPAPIFCSWLWGAPSKEEWMHRYGPMLKVSLCLGIGGTLDTIVGNVKRAPKLFQKLGLEWLYRLLRQPTRLRRQAALPLFACNVLREKARSLLPPRRKDTPKPVSPPSRPK